MVDLSTLDKAELVLMLNERGEEPPEKASKKELIALLQGSPADGQDEPEGGEPEPGEQDEPVRREQVEGVDEAVPGGRYLVNGRYVNAHGEEID